MLAVAFLIHTVLIVIQRQLSNCPASVVTICVNAVGGNDVKSEGRSGSQDMARSETLWYIAIKMMANGERFIV